MFVFLCQLQRKDLELHIQLLLLLIFCHIAAEFRHRDNTNVLSQLSGYSNNVGKLYVTGRQADEGEPGSRNFYRGQGSCGSSRN
jgi:hypothetical protein